MEKTKSIAISIIFLVSIAVGMNVSGDDYEPQVPNEMSWLPAIKNVTIGDSFTAGVYVVIYQDTDTVEVTNFTWTPGMINYTSCVAGK